jgi:hypothetical protein
MRGLPHAAVVKFLKMGRKIRQLVAA